MAEAEDGILEELLRGGGGGGGMARFFLIIIGVLGPPVGTGGLDRVVLVNPLMQGMVVLEGDAGHISDILVDGGAAGGRGSPLASKASIEVTVEVREGELLSKKECAVCSVCRYQMSVEEKEEGARKGGEREEVGERRERRREIWLTVAFGAGGGKDRQQEEGKRANGEDFFFFYDDA